MRTEGAHGYKGVISGAARLLAGVMLDSIPPDGPFLVFGGVCEISHHNVSWRGEERRSTKAERFPAMNTT